MNCYQKQIEHTIPRILAMYDRDITSESYGCGDRFYWGWKLIDYPNGTFQAFASGLAGLHSHGLLPEFISEEAALDLIHAIFQATEQQLSAKGSLDEAFPNEASFCVTGLVAGDLLLAIERLSDHIDTETREIWLEIVRPMIGFLHRQDEHHGIISNHLATNAVAMVRWTDLTGENVDARAKQWVDRILSHQSVEGWLREYEGADPGYQTWCTSSLAVIHRLRPDWGLEEPLARSLGFLTFAAHPDGSFGGIYGSRMTRFIFPAGLEMLSENFPNAKLLTEFTRAAISNRTCVTLEAIDPSNCIPIFNDYVTALLIYLNQNEARFEVNDSLPSLGDDFTKVYSEAGWFIQRKNKSYTVLNLYCGGAGVNISEQEGYKQVSGFVGKNQKGEIFTTQFPDRGTIWELQGDSLWIKSSLYRVNRPKPDALRFMILRGLCITAFKSIVLGNWVKKLLVKMLVTGKSKPCGTVRRYIHLSEDIVVDDYAPGHLKNISDPSFKPVHMASFGYWQRSDTCGKKVDSQCYRD